MKKSEIENLDEAALRRLVIIPVLEKMGFFGVTDRHGSDELGKDIVCWALDKADVRRNYAVVAKAKQLDGSALGASEVAAQILQCFNAKYCDPSSPATEQTVHEVYVISNKKITQRAQNTIRVSNQNSSFFTHVTYFDLDHLHRLAERYLPSTVIDFAIETQKRAELADTHWRPIISTSENGLVMALQEKFPGAANEKPINFHPTFISEHAKLEFGEILAEHHRTGKEYIIPGSYFALFAAPDVFKDLFGIDELNVRELRILSTPLPGRNLSFRFTSGTTSLDIPNVHFQQIIAGTDEILINATGAHLPCEITIAASRDESEVNITFTAHSFDLNAVQLLGFLQIINCINSTACIEAFSSDTGIKMFANNIETRGGNELPSAFLELAEKLAYIQTESSQVIKVPRREFTKDEVENIYFAENFLRHGRRERKWREVKMNASWSQEVADNLITTLSKNDFIRIEHYNEVSIDVFGTLIDLGKIARVIQKARVQNKRAVVKWAKSGPTSTVITLVCSPDVDDICVETRIREGDITRSNDDVAA